MDTVKIVNEQELRIANALAPFGWTCTPDFWKRYYADPWVFNLANAVALLTDRESTSSQGRET